MLGFIFGVGVGIVILAVLVYQFYQVNILKDLKNKIDQLETKLRS